MNIDLRGIVVSDTIHMKEGKLRCGKEVTISVPVSEVIEALRKAGYEIYQDGINIITPQPDYCVCAEPIPKKGIITKKEIRCVTCNKPLKPQPEYSSTTTSVPTSTLSPTEPQPKDTYGAVEMLRKLGWEDITLTRNDEKGCYQECYTQTGNAGGYLSIKPQPKPEVPGELTFDFASDKWNQDDKNVLAVAEKLNKLIRCIKWVMERMDK